MSEKSNPILKIFNYIGGALVFFGVTYFVGSKWYALSDFIQVFVSFGSAVAAFIVGLLLQKAQKYTASSAFFLISGLLLPVGLYIAYKVYEIPIPNRALDLMISAICFAVFLISYLRLPRTILLFFSIVFGSYLYFSMIEFLLYGKTVQIEDIDQYELITLGLSYIFLGYYLKTTASSILSGPLYLIGALFVLTAAYFLGHSSDPRFIFYWRLPALLSITLAFVFAVILKIRSFFYLASAFLVIYVIDMSMRFAEIFGDIGWSLILIITGFLLMILGYLVYFIHTKMTRR
jgi:hypothetical protein